jgi:competence protein ComEC
VLCVVQAPARAQEPVRIEVLNVGSGDANLIRTPNERWILIDGGSKRAAVDSLLTLRGVDRLELAILTHRHEDHLGGLLEVTRAFPIEMLVADTSTAFPSTDYRNLLELVRTRRLPVRSPSPGDLLIDGVRFVILPRPPSGQNEGLDENNRSLVVRLEYGRFSMLFPADVGRETHQWLIERHGSRLPATVLKAAHHGTERGTSHRWLEAVSPGVIVISAGGESRYFGPTALPAARSVEAFIASVGANHVYCTNRQGTILILGYEDGRTAVRPERPSRESCTAGAKSDRPTDAAQSEVSYSVVYKTPAAQRNAWLTPVIIHDSAGLRYVPGGRHFRGRLWLRLVDSSSLETPVALSRPFRIELHSQDSVQPTAIRFDSANTRSEPISVVARLAEDSVRIRVAAELDPEGFEVRLPLQGALLLSGTPRRIQGFGLQAATITLRKFGVLRDTALVQIESDQGDLSREWLSPVANDSTSESILRSQSVGVDIIRVVGPGQDEMQIVYLWPYRFVILALLGGLAGAALRTERTSKRRRYINLLRGLVIGFVAAVGTALGINVLNLSLQVPAITDAAVFFVAALASAGRRGAQRILHLGGQPSPP